MTQESCQVVTTSNGRKLTKVSAEFIQNFKLGLEITDYIFIISTVVYKYAL